MALLSPSEIIEIQKALISTGLSLNSLRPALVQFIQPQFIASIQDGNPANAQVMLDLGTMSRRERLRDGQIPVQIYLSNASALLGGFEEQQDVINNYLEIVTRRATGAPAINVAGLPEIKEKIIHSDDTLKKAFLLGALTASDSVMKLSVPSILNSQPRSLQNGDPMIFLGTGWLLTRELIMTNHHVINARQEGEAKASDSDFKSQGSKVVIHVAYDEESIAGASVNSISVEAFDETLDYAILRVPLMPSEPLTTAKEKIVFGKDAIPVNIIQHPNGKSKRFGIRNNLVSGSSDTDLRYFTDTDYGSSGSPVFNDKWEVVALHRGSTYVSNVQFQGKATAYVNMGTHLHSIFAHVKSKFKDLATEIAIP